MERRHIIIAPGGILLPAGTQIAEIFFRRKSARGQPDGGHQRLDGRSGSKSLPESIIKRPILVFIQTVPLLLGHAQNKIIAVIRGSTHQSQHFSRIRIHSHRAALILTILVVQSRLQLRIDGQPDILAVFFRGIGQNHFFFSILILYIYFASVLSPQLLFIKSLRSAAPDLAVTGIAFPCVFFQIFFCHILYISHQMCRFLTQRIISHFRIGNHHPRDLQQLIRQFLILSDAGFQVLSPGKIFQRHKGLLCHPGSPERLLDILHFHLQQRCQRIEIPFRRLAHFPGNQTDRRSDSLSSQHLPVSV